MHLTLTLTWTITVTVTVVTVTAATQEIEIKIGGEHSVASNLLLVNYSEIIDYYSLAIQNNEDIMERNEDIIGNARYIGSQFDDIIRRLN